MNKRNEHDMREQSSEKKVPFKAGFVGLIGQPNAGKSTLLNVLVQEKVSIVSPKPQTTRRRVMGMINRDSGQIIFVDAPGVIKSDSGLNGFLALEAQDVILQSDVLLAVLSLDEKSPEDLEKVLSLVKDSGKPWVAVITKTDLQEKAHRLPIIRQMIIDRGGVVFAMGGLDKANSLGTEELVESLLGLLPDSPAPLYDLELFTTESVRDLATEIIREKCFETLHMEIPYCLAVRIIKFDESATPCPKIYAEILLAKENHKAIVIGKGGINLKTIGTAARQEIEKIMDEKVFLDLTVSYKKDWYSNKNLMKELRYVVEPK